MSVNTEPDSVKNKKLFDSLVHGLAMLLSTRSLSMRRIKRCFEWGLYTLAFDYEDTLLHVMIYEYNLKLVILS